jgi:hypothetical protein
LCPQGVKDVDPFLGDLIPITAPSLARPKVNRKNGWCGFTNGEIRNTASVSCSIADPPAWPMLGREANRRWPQDALGAKTARAPRARTGPRYGLERRPARRGGCIVA